jgi:transposase
VKRKKWVIPNVGAEFVWRMEDVLDVYARPYDPKRPVVCFDELLVQLIAETRKPLPPKLGQPERFDYEYKRNGTRNLFFFFQPLAGWRHIRITEHRTKIDYAHAMRYLVDELFPEAEVVIVVEDNLNTHTPAALYEAFEPAEAKRILDRLEFHYTPKHGSWLNMVEIELSILCEQCLDDRIPDDETLRRKVEAWESTRNEQRATVNWRFSTSDARVKLERLYPNLSESS